MLLQELLDLFHQPVVELLGHDGEVQRGRCVLREIKEAALDTLKAVLYHRFCGGEQNLLQ